MPPQMQAYQGAYPPIMPPVGGYPYTYMPHPVMQMPNMGQQVDVNVADPLVVLDLDDSKKQEKLATDAYEQADNEALLKFELIEERLRVMEGGDMHDMVDANRMSLVPDLVLPPKFKVPDFEKYDGTKCPSTHLFMIYRKMIGYIKNEKLMIHCFQDSLTRSTTRLYNQLDRNDIRSWRDLGRAFLT